jgi:tRNA pseudouridine55 synthase
VTDQEVPAGLLLVRKPSGPSSRKIVDEVVRQLGTRRVGHAGTLDPFADGLLLVLWGRATALVPYLLEYSKRYLATVRFGRTTDTQDRTGTVIEERDPSGLTAAAIEEALPRFRGTILQAPPAFSAARHRGERLYRLARRGTPAEGEPRERTVHEFRLVEWDPPRGRFEVICSKGTYIRALAHDLGNAVGTGAMLEGLTRSAVGPFTLEGAVEGSTLAALGRDGLLTRALPPADALPDWPAVSLDAEASRAVRHGSWDDPEGLIRRSGRFRLLDGDGTLLSLAEGGERPRLVRVLAGAAA